MMTGAILRTWKNIKSHVPLIKFRKGGFGGDKTPAATAAAVGKPATRPSGASGSVIEDWELPPHYRRAPLDDKEIDAINRRRLLEKYKKSRSLLEGNGFQHRQASSVG